MQLLRFVFCLWCVAVGAPDVLADVRLLTGDSNDQIHESSADVVDVSADGDFVAIITGPPVTGSTPGIDKGGLYVRQLSAGTLEYVAGASGTYVGVGDAAVSDDGRYVAWRSTTNTVSGSSNHAKHIYWMDRQDGTARLITAAAEASCNEPKISGDGRYVSFVSASRELVADAGKLPTTAGRSAVFLYDSADGSLDIVSLAADGSALAGIGGAASPPVGVYDFSADGRYVAFSTDSANAHPDRGTMTAGFLCVCRRDVASGEVVLLNRNAAGDVVNGSFNAPRLSADGGRSAFTGGFIGFFPPTTPLVAGVPPSTGADVYLKDVAGGEVWWVSQTTDGTAHAGVFGTEFAVSGDGSVVSYASTSNKLTNEESDPAGGGGGSFDVFRADLAAGGAVTTTLITKSPSGSGNVGYRSGPVLAGDGGYVAFNTDQVEEMTGEDSTFSQGIGVGTFPGATGGGVPYADWASVLDPAERGLGDNPAGDRVDNLTKYMMGMDPTVPDVSGLPVMGRQAGTALGLAGDARDYLTLTVRIRRVLPEGFSWSVRAADSVAGLAADGGSAVQVGAAVADGEFDVYLFRFPSAVGVAPGRGFMDVALVGM